MSNSEWDASRLLATLSREQAALTEVLSQFDDDSWTTSARADGWTVQDIVGHLLDSTYGLSRMVLGEIPSTLPTDQNTGWVIADEFNEQRRTSNRLLERSKMMQRLQGAFATAQRAIEQISDPDAAGPFGPKTTKGMVLRRVVGHIKDHRSELEELAKG